MEKTEYHPKNNFNEILTDVAEQIMILPQIVSFMNAGYNFHNARERVLYLERRKKRINYRNEHPKQ